MNDRMNINDRINSKNAASILLKALDMMPMQMKEVVQATKRWPTSECADCSVKDECDPLGEARLLSPECEYETYHM